MAEKIREGILLDNGDVVCPHCRLIVLDTCEVCETLQHTMFGAVLTVIFKCSWCGKVFVVRIEECGG